MCKVVIITLKTIALIVLDKLIMLTTRQWTSCRMSIRMGKMQFISKRKAENIRLRNGQCHSAMTFSPQVFIILMYTTFVSVLFLVWKYNRGKSFTCLFKLLIECGTKDSCLKINTLYHSSIISYLNLIFPKDIFR